MDFKKGDRVRFLPKPEYGIGQVLLDNLGGDVDVFFVNAGKKRLTLAAKLEKLPLEDSKHPLLDHLLFDNKGEVTGYFLDFDFMVRSFLKLFPEGFNSKNYLEEERNYKIKAGEFLHDKLGEEIFKTLLEEENFQEISRRALQVLGKTNLVFPNEIMALKDGLKEAHAQKKFSLSLHRLLFYDGDLKPRIEDFIQALHDGNSPKWTILTYFLFLGFPDRYLFMKPTASQQAAQVFGFDIKYKSELNFNTFQAHQNFADYLFDKLFEQGPPLQPKDMIDVQGFVYCVSDLNKSLSKKKPA